MHDWIDVREWPLLSLSSWEEGIRVMIQEHRHALADDFGIPYRYLRVGNTYTCRGWRAPE